MVNMPLNQAKPNQAKPNHAKPNQTNLSVRQRGNFSGFLSISEISFLISWSME